MSGNCSEYGIALSQSVEDGSWSPAGLRATCALVESLGFGSAWVTDHLRGPDATLDPFTALSFCAASTERIRVGIAIAVSSARSPVQVAQAVASLDQLSGGRMEMGMGSGAPAFGKVFGIPDTEVFPRFKATIALMKRLWAESEVTWPGPYWELEAWKVGIQPRQAPHPPLWIGARYPSALKFAVEAGTGWIGAGSSSSDDFASQLEVVHQHLDAIGKDRSGFGIGKRVYLAVFENSARDVDGVRAWFGHHYGDPTMADRFAVMGTAVECAEQVAALRAAGARTIVLHPVFSTPGQIEACAELAALA